MPQGKEYSLIKQINNLLEKTQTLFNYEDKVYKAEALKVFYRVCSILSDFMLIEIYSQFIEMKTLKKDVNILVFNLQGISEKYNKLIVFCYGRYIYNTQICKPYFKNAIVFIIPEDMNKSNYPYILNKYLNSFKKEFVEKFIAYLKQEELEQKQKDIQFKKDKKRVAQEKNNDPEIMFQFLNFVEKNYVEKSTNIKVLLGNFFKSFFDKLSESYPEEFKTLKENYSETKLRKEIYRFWLDQRKKRLRK